MKRSVTDGKCFGKGRRQEAASGSACGSRSSTEAYSSGYGCPRNG